MFSLSSNSTQFSWNSSPHPYLQTDSSDLLGNWKPVDVRVLIRPAVAEFETLFESTLSSRANAELLTQLRLRLDKGKHSECIKIMSKGTHTPAFTNNIRLMFFCQDPRLHSTIF